MDEMAKCDECAHFEQWLNGALLLECKKHGMVEVFEAEDCKDFEYSDNEDEEE